MKVKKIFIKIDFDWVSGKFDYPQNVPLPRIGERIIFDNFDSRGCHQGRVYDITHIITRGTSDTIIKVKRD